MRAAPGCCAITVTKIELSGEGVVTALTGVWRARFGTAASSAGDVVLELLEPAGRVARCPGGPAETDTAGETAGEREPGLVGIRLLVAARDTTLLGYDRLSDGALSPAPVSPISSSGRRPTWRASERANWLWLGSWPAVDRHWPFLVGPLVFIAWEQERHALNRATRGH
jgi:hypothetical protein